MSCQALRVWYLYAGCSQLEMVGDLYVTAPIVAVPGGNERPAKLNTWVFWVQKRANQIKDSTAPTAAPVLMVGQEGTGDGLRRWATGSEFYKTEAPEHQSLDLGCLRALIFVSPTSRALWVWVGWCHCGHGLINLRQVYSCLTLRLIVGFTDC